ncbi:hypothetical protein C5O78_05290 [Treponema phagedenis]|nr:hypothetical protein C5O78_05290 [Treponema phagedenis]
MSKPNLRVLKLYKHVCFKTSFLLRTTAIRGGSEFCRPCQKLNLRVLKLPVTKMSSTRRKGE